MIWFTTVAMFVPNSRKAFIPEEVAVQLVRHDIVIRSPDESIIGRITLCTLCERNKIK